MFQHFILTYFNYRNSYFKTRKFQDPLNPSVLEHRFNIFQITCLPSILSQKNQHFTWIIIIDPALSQKYKDRLKALVEKKVDTHFVEFSPQLVFVQLDWLKKWILPETKYVVTTKLDNDDALYRGFTEYVHNYVSVKASQNSLPPMVLFGCKNALYWDFYCTGVSGLGYVKKRNPNDFPPSAGFSLCCSVHELNLTIIFFRHNQFDILSNSSEIPEGLQEPVNVQVQEVMNKLIKMAAGSNSGWDGVFRQENFHVLQSTTPQTITLNHFDNIQYNNLFSQSWARAVVDPEKTFNGFVINFELATTYIQKFRKSPKLLVKMLMNHFRVFPESVKGLNIAKLYLIKLLKIKGIVKGYRKLG